MGAILPVPFLTFLSRLFNTGSSRSFPSLECRERLMGDTKVGRMQISGLLSYLLDSRAGGRGLGARVCAVVTVYYSWEYCVGVGGDWVSMVGVCLSVAQNHEIADISHTSPRCFIHHDGDMQVECQIGVLISLPYIRMEKTNSPFLRSSREMCY